MDSHLGKAAAQENEETNYSQPMAMETTPNDALVIIDLQIDFCPGGALAVEGGNQIVPLINRLAKRFDHVIATQDWHPHGHISFASTHGKHPFGETTQAAYGIQALWPDHCVQGTRGAELHPELNVDNIELLLRKGFRKDIDSYSAFLENDHVTATGFAGYLRERAISRLFFVGLAFDYCVGSSAEDGAELGFDCYVVEDATRGIDLHTMKAMEERLRVAGVEIVQSSDLL